MPATAQFIFQAHDLDKPEIIGRILQADDAEKIIVFTRTKRQAQRIAEDLAERGFKASPLHGDMAQVAREKALTRFREDKIRVLVATDVAARGIDVQGVSHVINYTCPEDEKTYIHRIGRTGRAGATGIAVTFVDWADLHRWKMINKALDLPFDEPQETYSTSEHLFHDLGIPAGTKGRIVDPAPRRSPSRARTTSGARPSAPATAPRSRTRSRQRSRTRGGSRPRRADVRRRRPRPAGDRDRRRRASGRSVRATDRRRRRSPGSSTAAVLTPSRRTDVETRRVVLPTRRSGDDDDLGADGREVPQRDRVGQVLPDAPVRLRRAQLGRASAAARRCASGSMWNPIAAPVGPWVKRTKYCITPESSTPDGPARLRVHRVGARAAGCRSRCPTPR